MHVRPLLSFLSAPLFDAIRGSLLLAVIAGTIPALAGPFEAAVAPTRITLAGSADQRIGQTLRVYNVGQQTTNFAFRTLDWQLSDSGQLGLHDELLPGSCRPWVTLERRSRTVAPRSDAAFRFQIDVPADAPRGECRFMIAVEGVDPAQQSIINSGGASLSLPVNGRIGVAVYLAVGGAQPVLQLLEVDTDSTSQGRQPVLRVSNTGDAHGRLDGTLSAVNAQGQRFELQPTGGPVLPGSNRSLTLSVAGDAAANSRSLLTYPLDIEGTLEWEHGAFKVKKRLP